jgi:beta-glucosidase
VGNIAGIPRLNFTGLCLQDGPLAIRLAIYASVFPAQLAAAASWDRQLNRQRGAYMGAEFRGKGAHVALGPVVGPLGRSPYGGRNWEGFSPDAYLSGVLVEETVVGIQSSGVQACTKHYIGRWLSAKVRGKAADVLFFSRKRARDAEEPKRGQWDYH